MRLIEMEKFKLLCSVILLVFNLVCCQYSQSPCPDIFEYDIDGNNIYGRIVLKPSEPVSQLVVRINFTVATQLYTNYVGRIEALEDNLILQNYNRGLPVQYRVHFPIISPLPRLTALTVNGDLLCYGPGDIPRPNQYVTTLSLQHTSFLQGGGYSFRPQKRPDQVLDLVGQFGDDAKVFTFNNNIDSSPSWNNNDRYITSFYIVNATIPYTQPTRPVFIPIRPVYEQTVRPSRPVFGEENFETPYDEVYDRQQQRPEYDRNQNRPIFQQSETPPVYEKPTTRPSRPVEDYPRPEITQKAIYQPAAHQNNNECGIIAGGNEKLPLIYNGNSYSRGDLPWLVAVYRNRRTGGSTHSLSFICGGTLVSNRHVVSAAHCMKLRSELTSVQDIVVKVGVHNLNDWGDDITVTRNLATVSIHESYNSTTLENDILIFTLNKRVEFNQYIRAACLWSGNTDLSRIVGASGVVAGWGDLGFNGGNPGEPQLVRLPIVSTAMCRASKSDFHHITFSSTFCAGDRKGSGPCRGDSGGGLYLLDNGKWRLRGVVSIALRPNNGLSTCDLSQYVVFTDTAQYLSWIRQIMSQQYFD